MVFDRKAYMKEYNRRYIESHREELKEKKKIYRKKHKEYIKEWQRIYREQHKDELKIKKKQYAETNKEWISEKKKIREAKKWYTTIHNKTWRYIREHNLRPTICPICWDDKWIIEAHHPDYTKWNEIVFCCQHCHHEIHNWYIVCPQPINILNL